MDITQELSSIFPTKDEIPPEFLLEGPINQEEYLVGGELRGWDGPMQEVLSPVCLRSETGIAQASIGRYPKLTPEVALEALKSASRAYDQGRGLWPTLPVQERIEHVAEFVYRMGQKRSDIVKLLMWEIGKSAQDSAKEFDRTVAYIQDSLEALKDLDRISSRFVIDGSIIGQIRRAPLGAVLCMGPYNYPLNETFTTMIPALLMGNTVVLKPPKY
jgi:glyceraldehyde-3-phosphate dehydrogenase (NADP+)